jgi:hypothetical protein
MFYVTPKGIPWTADCMVSYFFFATDARIFCPQIKEIKRILVLQLKLTAFGGIIKTYHIISLCSCYWLFCLRCTTWRPRASSRLAWQKCLCRRYTAFAALTGVGRMFGDKAWRQGMETRHALSLRGVQVIRRRRILRRAKRWWDTRPRRTIKGARWLVTRTRWTITRARC